jgi:hypothetical protein
VNLKISPHYPLLLQSMSIYHTYHHFLHIILYKRPKPPPWFLPYYSPSRRRTWLENGRAGRELHLSKWNKAEAFVFQNVHKVVFTDDYRLGEPRQKFLDASSFSHDLQALRQPYNSPNGDRCAMEILIIWYLTEPSLVKCYASYTYVQSRQWRTFEDTRPWIWDGE